MQGTNKTFPIKVMLIDDSSVARGLMARALEGCRDITVIATAADAKMALETLKHHMPDVIILDIEMPEIDGISALPLLLDLAPQTHIIIVSTLSHCNAEATLRALQNGASDYLSKPSSHNKDAGISFYDELSEKIRGVGKSEKTFPDDSVTNNVVKEASSFVQHYSLPHAPIRAIAIAASTGGPQALLAIFKAISADYNDIPIFITQHIAEAFSPILARHINEVSSYDCVVAEHQMQVKSGNIYLARSHYHMGVLQDNTGEVYIALNRSNPINYCRPSADPMLKDLANIYGQNLLVLILTGMGHDGRDGVIYAKKKGAHIVAQDEMSSVVWGMPGAVVRANLHDAIIPLTDIPEYCMKAVGYL